MDLPLHPKLVHLPIALAILMPIIASGLLFAWWREWLPRRTWLLAVIMQVLLLGSGLLAQRTGEADEERAEAIVPEAAIEAHADAATGFVIGSAGVLVLVVAAAGLRNDRTARAIAALAAVGTVVVLLLGYRVGEAGGRLVYQHGAAAAFATPTSAAGGATPPARVVDDD